MYLIEQNPGNYSVFGAPTKGSGEPGFALGKMLFVFESNKVSYSDITVSDHITAEYLSQDWVRSYSNEVGTTKVEEWVRIA